MAVLSSQRARPALLRIFSAAFTSRSIESPQGQSHPPEQACAVSVSKPDGTRSGVPDAHPADSRFACLQYTVHQQILQFPQLKLLKKPALSTAVETAWLAAGFNLSFGQYRTCLPHNQRLNNAFGNNGIHRHIAGYFRSFPAIWPGLGLNQFMNTVEFFNTD